MKVFNKVLLSCLIFFASFSQVILCDYDGLVDDFVEIYSKDYPNLKKEDIRSVIENNFKECDFDIYKIMHAKNFIRTNKEYATVEDLYSIFHEEANCFVEKVENELQSMQGNLFCPIF
jgi:hypothetical protein